MSELSINPEIHTRKVGGSRLVTASEHLSYRVDQVEFPSGAVGEYTYIYDDYVAAATAVFDQIWGIRHLLLIRQERYPSQTVGWEIPAGRPKIGETALLAAQRELREEAGVTAEYWHQLPRQVENVGRGNSQSDLFVAAGILDVGTSIDPDEVITDRAWFPMDEVEDMMLNGQISSGHTLASLALANTFLKRNPDHVVSMYAG